MNESKIILLDCDGPLTAFDEEILSLVRPHTTKDELESLKNWDFFVIFNELELKKSETILNDPIFWRNQKPRDLSQKMVSDIRNEGHKIIFCTSPWESCREWEFTRRHWLKEHFGANGKNDVVITAKKELIFGHVFIDDKPDHIYSWKKQWDWTGGYSLLYETPSNKFTDCYPRIRVENGEWNFIKK